MSFRPADEPGRIADRQDDGTSVCTLGVPAHVPLRRAPTNRDDDERPVPAHVPDQPPQPDH